MECCIRMILASPLLSFFLSSNHRANNFNLKPAQSGDWWLEACKKNLVSQQCLLIFCLAQFFYTKRYKCQLYIIYNDSCLHVKSPKNTSCIQQSKLVKILDLKNSHYCKRNNTNSALNKLVIQWVTGHWCLVKVSDMNTLVDS